MRSEFVATELRVRLSQVMRSKFDCVAENPRVRLIEVTRGK